MSESTGPFALPLRIGCPFIVATPRVERLAEPGAVRVDATVRCRLGFMRDGRCHASCPFAWRR